MLLKHWLFAGRGRAARLALELRVPASAVSDWSRGVKAVPLEHCPYIEQFTEGAVTCEELRPDMAAYFALIRELAPAQRCRPESDALPDAAVGQGVAHG